MFECSGRIFVGLRNFTSTGVREDSALAPLYVQGMNLFYYQYQIKLELKQ